MFYFITARCHVSETEVFEEYLTILLPFIKNREVYHYSIENDGTCDRHIHALLEDNAKDRDAFMRKLNTKQFKEFWHFLKKTKLSVKEQLTYTEIIKEEEVKNTIGYIFKETNSRQGSSKMDDQKYIVECVRLYWTLERRRAEVAQSNIKDVVLMTGKNFYAKVQQFCQTTCTRYDDPDLLYKMKKSSYGFINLSRRQKEEGFRELRIMMNQEEKQDKLKVSSEMFENEDSEKEELHEDLLTLLYGHDNFEHNLLELRKKYANLSHMIKSNARV